MNDDDIHARGLDVIALLEEYDRISSKIHQDPDDWIDQAIPIQLTDEDMEFLKGRCPMGERRGY